MRKKIFFSIVLLSLGLNACKETVNPKDGASSEIIKKPTIKVENGKFTPEVMWSMGKLGEYAVSPDGKRVLYTVTYYSVEANKGNAEIYLMNVDGSDLKQLTQTAKSEFNPQWNPNKKRIGFLRGTDDMGPQLFEMDIDGKNEKQISKIDGGLEGFKYSPDGSKIFYIKTIHKDRELDKLYKGLPKATGRINEDLMYRHWDEWVDAIPHVFVADFNGQTLANDKDILENEPFECPMRPWGGIEQIAWSPDGKNLAYTCRKKTGKEYAISTNSDIYVYNIETKTTQNITEGMMGYDQNPVYSFDGKKIAWESMEREGYEADKTRLFIYDLETKEKKYLTSKLDQNVSSLAWSKDNRSIYFISPWHGVQDIYQIDISNDSVSRLTNGVHNYTNIQLGDNKLIASRTSMSTPAELFSVQLADNREAQVSAINKDLLAQVKMGKVEERWIETSDKKQMLTWIIYPPDFDSAKKYPAILYCQGGPQDMVSQFWSTRWNFQIMASAGYIVVAPNRRGLPGFGQVWNEQISGDYGGQNQKDYLSAIDAMAKEKYVDADRLGAVGASYGAFSVYWLAGNHDKRFKAFIAHNGMFNLEQQYLETEEIWFTNWDLGGPFWDKNNKVAQRSYANSPHKFVDKWDTPILIIHGELDYRIVASQGMAAYNAAVLRGVPARYLYFPDENHWVLQPQNSILWHRNFVDWLDKWLKK